MLSVFSQTALGLVFSAFIFSACRDYKSNNTTGRLCSKPFCGVLCGYFSCLQCRGHGGQQVKPASLKTSISCLMIYLQWIPRSSHSLHYCCDVAIDSVLWRILHRSNFYASRLAWLPVSVSNISNMSTDKLPSLMHVTIKHGGRMRAWKNLGYSTIENT